MEDLLEILKKIVDENAEYAVKPGVEWGYYRVNEDLYTDLSTIITDKFVFKSVYESSHPREVEISPKKGIFPKLERVLNKRGGLVDILEVIFEEKEIELSFTPQNTQYFPPGQQRCGNPIQPTGTEGFKKEIVYKIKLPDLTEKGDVEKKITDSLGYIKVISSDKSILTIEERYKNYNKKLILTEKFLDGIF